MDLRFYFTLFMRRIHYVILLTVLGAGIGITLALILPPRYVAEARLVVESQQIPDELAASTVRTDMIEQLQIIRQRILARNTLLDLADRYKIYRSAEGEALAPDEIVTDMRSRIGIETSGGFRRNQPEATLVDVSFSAESSALSAEVANQIVTLILQENVQMRTTVSGQTLDFFTREVERLDKELAERSARIVSFQEDNRDSLPESLDFRRNQLLSAQERQLGIMRDLRQLAERRESLVTLYDQTGGIGLQPEATLSPEARELQRLRERYASNSAVMTDANPRMKVMATQIEALERAVAAQQGATSPEDGAPVSPYEIQLADIDNQIEFLEEQQTRLEAEMAELRETIEATPNNAITLETLQRDFESLRAQYDAAVANRARAETGDTIEALSKGQRISVIENAIAPEEPNSPNRRKIALAGFGGGLLAGIGLVLLLELLNSSVRRSEDIIAGLDIKPIATLSYMRTRGEILRRRTLIAGVFLIAGAVIPAGLWVVDTYYRPVDLLMQEVLDRLPDIPVLDRNRVSL